MTLEYANAGGDRQVARSIARAPAAIRAAINRARQARGLEPVLSHAELAAALPVAMAAAQTAAAAGRAGPGVWFDNGGDLVPVTSSTTRPPRSRSTAPWPSSSRLTPSRTASRQGGRGPALQARVLIAPAYGLAAAGDLGRHLDERVAPGAFGPAAALNASGAWTLRGGGHDGVLLAVAGDRLRAHDTPAGLVVEWIPDLSKPWQQEAVRDLEAGHRAVSVMMRAVHRRTVRLPGLHELVVAATLQHIALLQRSGTRPCYPAATALVFRGRWRDDADELRRDIDKLVSECRFKAHRLGQ